MVVLQTEDLRIVRFAQACGIFGHRVQHRRNRRGRDDAQYLRGGSLLAHRLGKALTRLGDLASACFELLFEIGAALASSTNARRRSGQVKLATSRLALRPCARQGYLHRRTNPECWPSQRVTGPAGRIARSPQRASARLYSACRIPAPAVITCTSPDFGSAFITETVLVRYRALHGHRCSLLPTPTTLTAPAP